MTRLGYTLMTEQSGPRELVRTPWRPEQGHAPYAWTVLGAVAHATQRVELMTYVTCPLIRDHPAVVAQKAATLQDPLPDKLHEASRDR